MPTRNGLNPIGFLPFRSSRSIEKIYRTVLVDNKIGISRATVASPLLVVDQAPRVDRVDRRRPEQFCRDIGRYVECVAVSAVQPVTVSVGVTTQI